MASGLERRRESDEAVEHNLPAHLRPLWGRLKRGFEGSVDVRTTRFLEYAEEHPNEVAESVEQAAEARLYEMLCQQPGTKENKRIQAHQKCMDTWIRNGRPMPPRKAATQ